MHGHEFDGRDTQRLEVRDFFDDPQVRAGALDPACFRLGKAANMQLIDDRFGKIPPQVTVALPIELVVDDDTFGRANNAVFR